MKCEDLARRVAALLGERRIATAESCTAGRIVETLACVEGAADFLRGGLVAYGEDVKRQLLGVTAESVFSADAAAEMARGAAKILDAEVTVATTGVAGDESTEGTPAGTVFIAVCVDERIEVGEHHFDGTPEEVCDQAREQAFRDLIEVLQQG